ncbi:hypothetical protein HYW46_06800 [Candidatus Daviesbacteria bacterium]|nr:hypothetical protein [Candidatus Daviesbacteria bacterium]
MEFSPVSHTFDVNKDVNFYHQTLRVYGVGVGEKIALDVFKDNFRSQTWEASKTLKPYNDAYFIEEVFGEKRLVHSSDRYSGKDILEGIDKEFRRGAEYRSAINYRQRIFDAGIGESVIWVSPKGDGYMDTQINLAEKVNEGYVSFRQFQSGALDSHDAAVLMNLLSSKKVVDPESEPDLIITSVGGRNGKIKDAEVQTLILGLSKERPGLNFNYIEEETNRLSSVNAGRYLEAIKVGMSGESLKKYHSGLLFGAFFGPNPMEFMFAPMEIRTNCSVFDFGGMFMQPMLGMDYYFPPVTLSESKKNWCSSCQVENCCTSICYKCKGTLTYKKSSYL